MSNPPDTINHADLAQSRLPNEFRESTNIISYIRALVRENDELETVFQELYSERTLDNAVGVNLDILGDIVGQLRGFTQSVAAPFFGFNGAIGAGTFGTSGTPATGELFRSQSDIEFVDTVFDDDTYRIFIRAKIQKNKTRCRINETIDVVLAGVSALTVVLTQQQAAFTLTFPGTLSDDDKLLLIRTDYVPVAAGVNVIYADADGIFFNI